SEPFFSSMVMTSHMATPLGPVMRTSEPRLPLAGAVQFSSSVLGPRAPDQVPVIQARSVTFAAGPAASAAPAMEARATVVNRRFSRTGNPSSDGLKGGGEIAPARPALSSLRNVRFRTVRTGITMLAMAKRRKESTPESRARAKAKARRTRARLTPAAARRGLSAEDVALPLEHEDIAPVVVLVRKAGGAPLGAYREPLGGRPLLLASLPFAAVQPTPFQRDLSPTHARRLADAIEAAFAAQFESAELLTLGLVYEEDLRFGGGAYSPMLKKVDRFTTRPLPAALREREGYARRLRAIDVEVKRIVARLQAR